jgi:hypothetical protein
LLFKGYVVEYGAMALKNCWICNQLESEHPCRASIRFYKSWWKWLIRKHNFIPGEPAVRNIFKNGRGEWEVEKVEPKEIENKNTTK